MDAVTLAVAQADARRKYAPFARALLDSMPGPAALPPVMTSPPTLTKSEANAATSITSPQVLRERADAGTFTRKFGQPVTTDVNFYWQTVAPAGSSQSPWEREFIWDTALGEIEFEVRGGGAQLIIDGQRCTTNDSWVPVANDGNTYRLKAAGVAAGIHRVRFLASGNLKTSGTPIVVGPSDTVIPVPPRREIWGLLGDSFSEPTVAGKSNETDYAGWPTWLATMAGVEMKVAAKGGAGYVTLNGASTDGPSRMPGLLAMGPLDRVILALGINDETGTTYATVKAAAASCIAQAKAAGLTRPDQIIVASPFWNHEANGMTVGLWRTHDAVQDAASDAGVLFVDLMSLPFRSAPPTAGVLSSPVTAGALTCSSSVSVSVNNHVRIGNQGGVTNVRRVAGVSGSGPYTLTFTATLSAHSAGEQVVECGPAFWTGTGSIASPANNGNSDRYIAGGADPTHPTFPGHRGLSISFYDGLVRALEAATA